MQLADMRVVHGRWAVELSLGDSFGRLRFDCASARGVSRGSTARQIAPGEWEYLSRETGEQFDFYAPFAVSRYR